MLPPEHIPVAVATNNNLPSTRFSTSGESCTCEVMGTLKRQHSNVLPLVQHQVSQDGTYRAVRLSCPMYATYDTSSRTPHSTLSRKTVDYSQYVKSSSSERSERSESMTYFALEDQDPADQVFL